MRKSVIYTLLAISLFAMLGTGCSKKAEQKSETTKSAAQTESVGESIGDQTADTEKMTESETEKKKETKTTQAQSVQETEGTSSVDEEFESPEGAKIVGVWFETAHNEYNFYRLTG